MKKGPREADADLAVHKLRHVRERMLTGEGRRLAEERHEFMLQFFDRLKEETEGKI
ncbi:MAG: hypothetical protein WC956_05060 [bacterium]